MESDRTTLILVGGFLGAGKTTLLRRAGRSLAASGKRVGLITNDQAPDLVDTGLLRSDGLRVEEVAGGCFCCRFPDLISAAERLMAGGRLPGGARADVILGEPVGSCTDLSATVLQPLKDNRGGPFRPAPFSVLVDPRRLLEVLEPRRPSPLHASARYILAKQLEEADLVLINKADLLAPAELAELEARVRERFRDPAVRTISALTGLGVEEWLAEVLAGPEGGRRVVEVDYDIYAEGESVLGWLNARGVLESSHAVDWESLGRDILAGIAEDLRVRGAEPAHLKLLLFAPTGAISGSITRGGEAPAVRGAIGGSPRSVDLVVNARVQISPQGLRETVEGRLRGLAARGITARVGDLVSLSPGRPVPVHRYARAVEDPGPSAAGGGRR